MARLQFLLYFLSLFHIYHFAKFLMSVYVGQRVSYNGELCTIRYVGGVEGTKGKWLGVEWDDATRGKHNGEAGGKRYFECTRLSVHSL